MRKRSCIQALAIVLGVGLACPALAQSDNFPDVPQNHWAFEDIARLKKDGLLVGYPDGLFKGLRPASRYELAVALHAAYVNLRNVTDGLQSQIDALKNNSDVQALKDQIASLQAQMTALKSYGDDIAALKRLTDSFANELHALGVDVDQLKKDLGDLARRVTVLEAKKPSVDIGGDASFFAIQGNSRDNVPGLSMDGRFEGVLKDKAGSGVSTTAGLDKDVSILNELALTMKGAGWQGTIVYGNVLDNLGNMSTQASLTPIATSQVGLPYSDTAAAGFYVQDLSYKFDVRFKSTAVGVEVGRIGYKVGPYILQREIPSSYYANSRWDNGLYYLDGGKLNFNLLGGKVEAFGGRTSNQLSSEGIDLNPLQSGGYGGPLGQYVLGIDRAFGVSADSAVTKSGHMKVAYLWLDSNPDPATGLYPTLGPSVGIADRLEVYGDVLDFSLGALKLQGDYSKSIFKLNEQTVSDRESDMWLAKASVGDKKWDLYGFYRQIGANFAAPGDWGRIGILRNPTNIEGETAGASLHLSTALVLKGNYEHEEGKDSGYESTSAFGSGTKLDKYDLSLGYGLSSHLNLSVGYEDDHFKNLPSSFSATGNPDYKWTTFGLGYGLSDAAKLTLQYQLSDVNNEFVLPAIGLGPTTRYKGGLLTSQLTVKF